MGVVLERVDLAARVRGLVALLKGLGFRVNSSFAPTHETLKIKTYLFAVAQRVANRPVECTGELRSIQRAAQFLQTLADCISVQCIIGLSHIGVEIGHSQPVFTHFCPSQAAVTVFDPSIGQNNEQSI